MSFTGNHFAAIVNEHGTVSGGVPDGAISAALQGACTSGNAIVCASWGYLFSFGGAPTAVAVSDNQNGSYTLLKFAVYSTGSNGYLWAAIHLKQNVSATTPTITITPSYPAISDGNFVATSAYAEEASGIATTGDVSDQTGTSSAGSGSDNDSGTAASAISQANELFIAVLGCDDDTATSFTENYTGSVPSSGWVQWCEDDAPAIVVGAAAYYENSSGTPTPVHHWLRDSSTAWIGILATIKTGSPPADLGISMGEGSGGRSTF